MADLSKIKLNGTTYNFKDNEARNLIENFEETDPTVPNWAKQTKKPTYTASEVGALPLTSFENVTITNEGKSTSFIKFKNDDNDPGVIEISAETIKINGVVTPTSNTMAANKQYVDTKFSSITHPVTSVNGKKGAVVLDIPTVPTTVSSFTNDSGYQTASDVNSLIGTAIGDINSFEVSIVSSLPANPDTHTIYFMSNGGSNQNSYDEYMYINNSWEKIGTTDIDLSGYLQTTDIADWAKASTKPTYTAMEVGALPNTYTAPVTSVNGQTGAVSLSIPTVPTNVSSFTNDAGYLTLADLPIYNGEVS